jgi:quercetin dioxygenase-like cupin family protein
MRRLTVQRAFPLILLLCGFPVAAIAQNDGPRPVLPENLQWTGVPNAPALQGAWVVGSEQAAGAYVLRVRIAADGRIPPHVHPDSRSTTVLSGTLYVGFGETFDASKVVAVPSGAVYVAPANIAHYVWAKDGNVEYQETGVGPTGTLMMSADGATGASPAQTGEILLEGSVAMLSWLTGCWRAESADSGSGEQWLPPAGGAMLGVERTIEKGKLVSYGFMRIEANADGKLVFTASPSGQEQTSFTQVKLSRDAITFENLQHDFPQRVMYRLVSSERLAARIEGINDGVEQAIDFPMQRISCDALVKVSP